MKRAVLRVVLDQPRLYLEETLGSVMVRGEVIVNFSRDTAIQGPIELLFEGIQKYRTWPEIMKRNKPGEPIETKLQVIELSLLPPNSRGIMPAGVQRFPFEFPIPSALPPSLEIPDRLEIFYQLTATLRRSSDIPQDSPSSSSMNWIEWARRNSSKKVYVATSPMRIVRAMESIVSDGLPTANADGSTPSLTLTPVITTENGSRPSNESSRSNNNDNSITNTIATGSLSQLPWNRRGLDEYQGTLDEQPDQLAFSLSGRTCGNFNQPIHMLEETQGIRYRLGVDRTAIAIGTSIGIELMVEPTFADTVIKSAVLKISENRKYTMKVPSDHPYNTSPSFETKKYNEGIKMVMKWAFGYQVENDDGELNLEKKNAIRVINKPGDKYVRERSCSSQFLAYFDPPQPGHPSNKFFLGNHPDNKPVVYMDNQEEQESNNVLQSSSLKISPTIADDDSHDIINLKELNQSVRVGEYFGGRFVMPMPDCEGSLNPSMEYESISISHWLQLIVTVECNGKEIELTLDSPSRMLDCRVVSSDDERQTILPPPPSYEPGSNCCNQDWSTGTFWEQREPITTASGWGACVPCPCEAKKIEAQNKCKTYVASNNNQAAKSKKKEKKKAAVVPSTPSNLLPEWGPPPAYEN